MNFDNNSLRIAWRILFGLVLCTLIGVVWRAPEGAISAPIKSQLLPNGELVSCVNTDESGTGRFSWNEGSPLILRNGASPLQLGKVDPDRIYAPYMRGAGIYRLGRLDGRTVTVIYTREDRTYTSGHIDRRCLSLVLDAHAAPAVRWR